MTVPAKREQHNQYQRDYYTHTERATIAAVRTPYVDRHIDEALRAVQASNGATVLDVGCGRGRHAFALKERGFMVEGLELSEDLLERMREDDPYGIPMHCGDICDPAPALHGRFDAVVGFFVLHHLLDLHEAFRGIAKLVRPGGRVAFVEPNPANPSYWLQITLTPSMSWRAERGIFNMRRRLMREAMTSAGLVEPTLHRFGVLPPGLRNRPWGGRVDSLAESIPPLRPVLAFQVFSARRPA